MFSSMDMQDLGLGSLPDLDFAERLDGVYNNQDLVCDGQLDDDEYSSLFKELEEFNNGLMTKERRAFSTDFTNAKVEKVKSSGSNILSQAVTEAAIFENQLSPTGSNSNDETDNSMLISEMETFLAQYERVDAQEEAGAGDSVSVASPLTADESRQAEDILDALIAGNIKIDPSMDIDEGNEPTSSLPDDSGYLSNISDLGNVSNISEVVTEDGQKVVIIITNDLEEPRAIKEEPRSPTNPTIELRSNNDQDSDSDWSPGSSAVPTPSKRKNKAVAKNTKAKSGRVAKTIPKTNGRKRGPYKLSTYHNIKDKKERKKAQNVEAARRYRDKKKVESDSVFTEEAILAERNKALRSKAAEIENEVKTLKKLMIELGLVK